jgi:S-adenosyl-L-methionine hydrolase (adenosine-forming)
MSLLTITTDLGYRDPYLAIVKAKLLTQNKDLQIIDLSCDIKDNNISDAAFILKNALPHFPENTIHLVAVKFISERNIQNTTSSVDNTRYLVTYYKKQYILCPDNGLFTLIDSNFNEPVYQLYYSDDTRHHFFLKDIFVNAALALAANSGMQELGMITNDYYKAMQFESFAQDNMLRGKGIYIDDFGNIITNITRKQFEAVVGRRNFSIRLPGIRLNHVSSTYDEVQHGHPLILFNSFDNLELAINGGSAHKMLCKRDIGSKFDFNLIIEIDG